MLDRQAGVVARRQLLAIGGRPSDIERLLRRRLLVRLLPGVFLDHTGRPTWEQRAWAGVLFYAPAALAHGSALRAALGPWRMHDDPAPIEVAVDEGRSLRSVPGYRVRRVSHLDAKAQWHLAPPRLRVEEAALDVAARASSEHDAVQVLAEVCQRRRSTPGRLAVALAGRTRLPRGRWLAAVLDDLDQGVCSVLEHGYRSRVQRPHALPAGSGQAPGSTDGRPSRRDVGIEELGVVIELDGRLFHDNAAQRDVDLDRDLEVAADSGETVRLGWGQVFDRPCRTAVLLGRLLARRGWRGEPRPCGSACVAPALRRAS